MPSLDGKDRCKFTRQIFVQKGQKVKIGEPVKVSFFRQVAPGATSCTRTSFTPATMMSAPSIPKIPVSVPRPLLPFPS